MTFFEDFMPIFVSLIFSNSPNYLSSGRVAVDTISYTTFIIKIHYHTTWNLAIIASQTEARFFGAYGII